MEKALGNGIWSRCDIFIRQGLLHMAKAAISAGMMEDVLSAARKRGVKVYVTVSITAHTDDDLSQVPGRTGRAMTV